MVQWRVHGERMVYESPWVSLALTTVEPPSVAAFEHHVVRARGPAAGCIVTRAAPSGRSAQPTAGTEVLMLYRHRFITDTWGWEIPAGGVDSGEDPATAAARETREETGWQLPALPRPVTVFHPSNGLSDQTFHIFHGTNAEHVGDPLDPTEASRIEWIDTNDVRSLIADGQVTDGLSLTALAVAFTLAVLP
ncbi:MAG: NUDIX hydrolase [Actinomycetota bacterium]